MSIVFCCLCFVFFVFVFGLAWRQALDLTPVKTSLLESSHGCGDICLGYAMSNTKEVLCFGLCYWLLNLLLTLLLSCHKTLKKWCWELVSEWRLADLIDVTLVREDMQLNILLRVLMMSRMMMNVDVRDDEIYTGWKVIWLWRCFWESVQWLTEREDGQIKIDISFNLSSTFSTMLART